MICLASLETESDRSSFEKIYDDNKNILYRYAYSILGDSASAEDAVQDAFVSLAQNFEKTYKMECNQIRSYLIIIVRNAAFKIYNRRKREVASEDIYAGDEPTGEELHLKVEDEELRKKMFEMIKELDSKYGDILMLRYYCGMPEKDIAESLGLSIQNVKVRLFRARNLLKEKLKEGGYCD